MQIARLIRINRVRISLLLVSLILFTSHPADATEIPTGITPYGIAVSPNGLRAYVANWAGNSVSILDLSNNTSIKTITSGMDGPFRVAVTPNNQLIFVTNQTGGTVSVIDSSNNDTLTSIVGFNYPNGILVSPDGSKAYVSNSGTNSVKILDVSSKTITGDIMVGSSPQGLAITPDGSKLVVANYGDNTASIVNLSSNSVIATVSLGSGPMEVAITPDGLKAYISNYGENTVSVVNLSTNGVIKTINVGANPYGLAVTPGLSNMRLYVNNKVDDTISVINVATDEVIGSPVPVGSSPTAIAINNDGTKAYVTNNGSANVSVFDLTNVLQGLSLNKGTLDPAFNPNVFSYKVNVDSATSSVAFTPTFVGFGETATLNGNLISTGSSNSIPLVIGSNSIKIITYNQDGVTKKTYEVIINRLSGKTCSPNSSSYLDPGTGTKYRVLSFLTTESCDWTVPSNVSSAKILVVGGGGAGGGGAFGGGGGGGGYLYSDSYSLKSLDTYTISVGVGGVGGIASLCLSNGCQDNSGGNGGNSSFGSLISIGGGGGGGYATVYSEFHTISPNDSVTAYSATSKSDAGIDSTMGKSGGSGGGSSENTYFRASGTSGQGNGGGTPLLNGDLISNGPGHNQTAIAAGAGGGGAAASGKDVNIYYQGANGGSGVINSITNSPICYAAGGGGGGSIDLGHSPQGGLSGNCGDATATSGNGGGGSWGWSGVNGDPGTGSGGGGAGWNSLVQTGGNGGSGVVNISFAMSQQSPLTITPADGKLGLEVNLTTSGGSGSGAISYSVDTGTASGCSISGSALTAKSEGTCLVIATKAEDVSYLSANSTQVAINFQKYFTNGNFTNDLSGWALSKDSFGLCSTYPAGYLTPLWVSASDLLGYGVHPFDGGAVWLNGCGGLPHPEINQIIPVLNEILYQIEGYVHTGTFNVDPSFSKFGVLVDSVALKVETGTPNSNGWVKFTASFKAISASAILSLMGEVGGDSDYFADSITINALDAPKPIQTNIPDPVQTSSIISSVVNCSSDGTQVNITGNFDREVTAIELNGKTLNRSLWTYSSTKLIINLNSVAIGSMNIQIFNGASPLLSRQTLLCLAPKGISNSNSSTSSSSNSASAPNPSDSRDQKSNIETSSNSTQVPNELINDKKVSKTFIITFPKDGYLIPSAIIVKLKRFLTKNAKQVLVEAYASKNSGQYDLLAGLNRRIETSKTLRKLNSNLIIKSKNLGTKINPLCRLAKNQCAVITVIQ